MKWNSIGASLVRLFRPAATSVSPKIGLDGSAEMLDILRKLTAQSQPQASSEPAPSQHAVQIESGAVDTRPGVKPPADHEWTWLDWSALARGNGHLAGWSFCRFANRLGQQEMSLVFGFVRGAFGVWQSPFPVCSSEGKGEDILTALTHLPSGLGMGVFADRSIAVEAAELAERVCPAWATLKDEDDGPLREAAERTRIAWAHVGIIPANDAHAHDRNGFAMSILGRSIESITEGKPELLS